VSEANGATEESGAAAHRSIAAVLEKVSRSWPDRAQVRRDRFEPPVLEPNRPDFLDDLLPFGAHAVYRAYAPELQQQVLTCGWLIYNQKTIAIELDLITPACIDLMRGPGAGGISWEARAVIAQTLTDEAYHTLLAVNVCKLASLHRDITLPRLHLHLLERLARSQAAQEPRDGWLARLAYATVSELFVSDYLRLLSTDRSIQPIYREAVAAHERDERTHRKLFPLLLHGLVPRLCERQRRVFVNAAAEAILAFGDREYGAWSAALDCIDAPDRRRLLEESSEANASRVMEMDCSVLRDTLAQLGLTRDAYAIERLAELDQIWRTSP